MNRDYVVLLVFLALVMAGCASGANNETVQVGEPFILAGGDTVDVEPAGFSLTFSELLEDSRCPTEVNCVETGQARILLTVQSGAETPTDLEFNTNPAPGMTQMTDEYGEYVIELVQLDPYPQNPEKPIRFADYRASLIVRE